jgi:3-phenylpropionate/trans-cinnamate dioxygenase ferredoxin subunit
MSKRTGTAAATKMRYQVCPIDELPDGARRLITAGGRSIGVFNSGGRYYALLNRCPHGGAPLCLGTVSGMSRADRPGLDVDWGRDGEILRCPWHGWEFELATGKTVTAPTLRVKSFPVTVADGSIVVEV